MIKLILCYNRQTTLVESAFFLICRCRFPFSSDKPDQDGGASDAGGPSLKPGTSKTSQKKKENICNNTNKKVKKKSGNFTFTFLSRTRLHLVVEYVMKQSSLKCCLHSLKFC